MSSWCTQVIISFFSKTKHIVTVFTTPLPHFSEQTSQHPTAIFPTTSDEPILPYDE